MSTRLQLIFILTFSHLLISTFTYAQSPQAIPYQAIARDVNGSVLSNQSIGLRITLIDSNINLMDYQETHLVTTNALGLFTLNIGQGTPLFGTFSAISWPISGNEHIQVEMDAAGGTNYTTMGITKLNSVPFALHANTSSDNKWNANGNNIYNNNAGNLGIGTSSPGAKLDVNGMAFFRNNAGGFVTGGGTGVKISTENNKGGIFGFDYTNFAPIDLILQGEGANVGIGNHFPESTLHITKPNDATTVTIGGNSQAGQFTALRLQTSANQGGYSNIQSIKYSGYDFGDLILNKDGGNIGIGTASPSAKLEVAGNVKIADGTQGSGKVLTSDANGMATWQAPSGTFETDPKVGTLAINTIPTWNGTSLANGTITDITNKIGIGTSSPSEQLHTTGGVRHESLGGTSKRPVYADANGKLSAGNDTLVSSTLTTNISYSFTNLFSPLSLSGLPASINPKDLSIEVHGLNNDAISVFLQAPNGDVLNLFNTSYSSFNALFSDEASTLAPTNSNNYTGSYKPTGSMTPLGSISPTVSTFASMGGGAINPNGTWTLIVIVQPSFLGFNLDNWSISYHNAQLAQGSNHYVPLWENGNLSITSSLYDNGNVGIHTTSPQRSLDVHGDIAQGIWTDNLPSRRIGVMDASTHVAGMEIENTTLSGNYSQKLHLLTHHYASTYGRRFTIDEDGRVGIGIETPNALLHVAGTGQFGNYLKIGTDISEGYFQNAQDGAYRALQTGGNQGYYFQNYNGANTSMFVGLNGTYQNKVGIGTATPQANLDVVGSTKTSSLQVTNGASNGAILTSDASGNASWTAPIGCVIRAQTFTASASGTGYAAGGAFAPATITASGIYGDTRLINSGAMNVTTGSATNTGLFTAPSDGYYQVSVKAISVASSVRFILLASLNGAAPVEILDQLTSNPCANCSDISHTQIIYLQAGDTHRILRSVSGTAINDMVISYRKL